MHSRVAGRASVSVFVIRLLWEYWMYFVASVLPSLLQVAVFIIFFR